MATQPSEPTRLNFPVDFDQNDLAVCPARKVYAASRSNIQEVANPFRDSDLAPVRYDRGHNGPR
jgi:hypothetical protein